MADRDMNWDRIGSRRYLMDRDAQPGTLTTVRQANEPNVVMCGRNTGSGEAVVYWRAPQNDPTGIWYLNSRSDATVPFSQLADVREFLPLGPYNTP